MTNRDGHPGGPQVWELLLTEARDLRKKQDARLAASQQRSAFLVVGFLTVAAIVSTAIAAPATGTTSVRLGAGAALALAFASASGVIWYLLHHIPLRWHEAPDVNLLVQDFSNRDGGHRALQRHLVQTLMDHYSRNEEVVGRVRFWVGVQAIVTFVGTALLIGALLALG